MKTSEIIFFLLSLILGASFMVIGMFGQYYQRKRKSEAIFIIPMRRIYFWYVCVLIAVIIIGTPLFSGFDLIITTILLTFSIGMAFWFSSSDILVLNDGIYCFMKFTRWGNITRISKDFLGLYFHTKKGVFKKVGYIKFIWGTQDYDFEKLQSLHAEKIKTAEHQL